MIRTRLQRHLTLGPGSHTDRDRSLPGQVSDPWPETSLPIQGAFVASADDSLPIASSFMADAQMSVPAGAPAAAKSPLPAPAQTARQRAVPQAIQAAPQLAPAAVDDVTSPPAAGPGPQVPDNEPGESGDADWGRLSTIVKRHQALESEAGSTAQSADVPATPRSTPRPKPRSKPVQRKPAVDSQPAAERTDPVQAESMPGTTSIQSGTLEPDVHERQAIKLPTFPKAGPESEISPEADAPVTPEISPLAETPRASLIERSATPPTADVGQSIKLGEPTPEAISAESEAEAVDLTMNASPLENEVDSVERALTSDPVKPTPLQEAWPVQRAALPGQDILNPVEFSQQPDRPIEARSLAAQQADAQALGDRLEAV